MAATLTNGQRRLSCPKIDRRYEEAVIVAETGTKSGHPESYRITRIAPLWSRPESWSVVGVTVAATAGPKLPEYRPHSTGEFFDR